MGECRGVRYFAVYPDERVGGGGEHGGGVGVGGARRCRMERTWARGRNFAAGTVGNMVE